MVNQKLQNEKGEFLTQNNIFVRRIIPIGIKEISDRVIEFTGSDETMDRADEIIRANGWDLKNYRKNPVFQWAHDYHLPPIGKSIKTWIDREEKKLKFNVEFADPSLKYPDTMPSPELIYRLYKAGIMRAVSVGFMPREWEEPEEDSEEREKGVRRIYKKQELLELSAVPVPANPNALEEAQNAELITAKELQAVKEWIRISDLKMDQPGDDTLGEENPEEKPYPNEHACRLRDPKDFQEGTMRRYKREHEGKEYSVIAGRLKGETTMTEQAFRYQKDIWPVAQARSHCKDHDGSFEAASSESNMIIGTGDPLIHMGSSTGDPVSTIMTTTGDPIPKINPEPKIISQEALRDDIDYLKGNIENFGISEEFMPEAWDLVREIMRCPGNDIPVDIAEKVGAVLSQKNKAKLHDIKRLAQEVLDSAEKPEEEPEKVIPEVWTPEDTAALAAKIAREINNLKKRG